MPLAMLEHRWLLRLVVSAQQIQLASAVHRFSLGIYYRINMYGELSME